MKTLWGKTGIAVIGIFNEGVGDMFVYDATGKELAHHAFGFTQSAGEGELSEHGIWVTHEDREYFGSTADPYMLDVLTDKPIQNPGNLEMFNPTAPNALRVSYTPGYTSDPDGIRWRVVDSDGDMVYDPFNERYVGFIPQSFTFAPNGQQFAFFDEGFEHPCVLIYSNGQVTEAFDDTSAPASEDYPGIQGLAWGAIQWQTGLLAGS